MAPLSVSRCWKAPAVGGGCLYLSRAPGSPPTPLSLLLGLSSLTCLKETLGFRPLRSIPLVLPISVGDLTVHPVAHANNLSVGHCVHSLHLLQADQPWALCLRRPALQTLPSCLRQRSLCSLLNRSPSFVHSFRQCFWTAFCLSGQEPDLNQ